jgi:O-6-methylguanine DNA methyltransferase
MRLVPRVYPSRKPVHSTLYYTLFASPLGRIGIASTPNGICRISLHATTPSAFRKALEREYCRTAIRQDRYFKDLVAGMRLYFSGQPVRFNTKIDLQEGTPFQKKVWRSLQGIPHGQTRSYQTVARRIGHPNSFRAVGGACGKNPVAVLIPCHRVINADGKLGGFTGGLRLKKHLLTLEHSIR